MTVKEEEEEGGENKSPNLSRCEGNFITPIYKFITKNKIQQFP